MILKMAMLILMCCIMLGCANTKYYSTDINYLSVSDVIENRSKYFGKKVTVMGFLSTQSENLHLFETSSQYQNLNYNNCLNISFDPNKNYYDERKRYHKKYVIISGTFGPITNFFFDTGGCGNVGISVDDMVLSN